MEPRQISLGLDLRGGSYLLLEVDLNTVVRERLESVVDGVRGKLRTANIRYVNLAADGPNRRMGFRVLDPAQAGAAASGEVDLFLCRCEIRFEISGAGELNRCRQKACHRWILAVVGTFASMPA